MTVGVEMRQNCCRGWKIDCTSVFPNTCRLYKRLPGSNFHYQEVISSRRCSWLLNCSAGERQRSLTSVVDKPPLFKPFIPQVSIPKFLQPVTQTCAICHEEKLAVCIRSLFKQTWFGGTTCTGNGRRKLLTS